MAGLLSCREVGQLGLMPRSRSLRRRSISTVVSRQIEIATRIVATARIVGEICSRRPVNICHGRVFCPAEPTKSTTTTSSKEVMNANRPPEITVILLLPSSLPTSSASRSASSVAVSPDPITEICKFNETSSTIIPFH